jgi:hypothetical protein
MSTFDREHLIATNVVSEFERGAVIAMESRTPGDGGIRRRRRHGHLLITGNRIG